MSQQAPEPQWRPTHQIDYRSWSGAEFDAGDYDGTTRRGDRIVLAEPTSSGSYTDPFGDGTPLAYEVAHWTSTWVEPGFAFVELVASWNALTPAGSWVAVFADVSDGSTVERCLLGRWAETTGDIHPTTLATQANGLARTEFDVLIAQSHARLCAWRLGITFARLAGTDASPQVTLAGAVVSSPPGDWPAGSAGSAQSPQPGRGRVVLDLPRHSQRLHKGRLAEFNGGGDTWCSPASCAMVLAHFGRGPRDSDLAWLGPDYPDPHVAHAAAGTFDYAYNGTGNWSFNAAYAARFDTISFVTRLRSLDEAERFIAAGIPLVASVAFSRDQLTGSGYDTGGHLLVIVGFDDDRDVVVNDPASHGLADNAEVRVTYDRVEFERAWMSGSGGIVYVIRPPEIALPARDPGFTPNW